MKLISIVVLIFLFGACKSDEVSGSDKFDFLIDSISNITPTSATIKATLYTHQDGLINISGLSVIISETEDITNDSLYQEVFFDKTQGTVELTVTKLNPNTLYYVKPVENYNPDAPNLNNAEISTFVLPNSTKTFITLDPY